MSNEYSQREALSGAAFCKIGARLASALLALALLAALPLRGAADEPDAIIDLNAQWKFHAILGVYDVDGRKLVCAETADRHFVYWDPPSNSLAGAAPANCAGAGGPLHLMVVTPEEGGLISRDTSFGGGARIFRKIDPYDWPECSAISSVHFEVTHPDGKTQSFYVVARLKQPLPAHTIARCGDDPAPRRIPREDFQQVFWLNSIAISEGRTLLMSGGGPTIPIFLMVNSPRSLWSSHDVLMVNSLPRSLWSSHDDVFILPYDSIAQYLRAAGGDEVARYQALLQAIGHSVP
jgi:hypothetical protein